jgi:hypothetical protein
VNILCKGGKDRLGSSNIFLSCVYIVADERQVIPALPRPLPSSERTRAKYAIFAKSKFIRDGVRQQG